MSLVKRVVSAVAGLAVVFSTVAPIAGTNAADYTELEAANKLATLGVIVDKSSTPAEYRLGDTITRREMLKVMMNLSSVTVTDTCEGKYADLSALDWGCKYAEAALWAGFIAPNANFRPDDNVSKIEALKMIMQARGIEKDASQADWRVGYVVAAVDAPILDASGMYGSFTDYDTSALRGWIFVVAAQAVDLDITNPECDMCLLLCVLDDSCDSCDAVCGKTEKTCEQDVNQSKCTCADYPNKPGCPILGTDKLTVTLSPDTPAAASIPVTAPNVEYMAFDLTAGTEDVTLESIVLKRVGLGSRDDFSKVWLTQDGVVVSNDKSIASDDTVTLPMTTTIKAGETITFMVNASMNVTAGETKVNAFQVESVTASSEVEAGTVRGNEMTTVDYSVAQLTFTPKGTATNIDAGAEGEIIGEFKLEETQTSSKKGAVLKSIRLKASGWVNLSDNLENIAVYDNGVQISTATVIDGDYVTFKFDDLLIEDAKSKYFEVKADVTSGDDGDTLSLQLKDTFDIYALEQGTNIGADVVDGGDLAVYTLNAGKVTVSQDTSTPESTEEIKDTDDVLAFVAKVDTDQTVVVDGFKLYFIGNLVTNTQAQLNKEIEGVALYVNDTQVDTIDVIDSTSGLPNSGTGYYNFDSSFELNDNDLIKVYVDLTKDAVAGTKVQFKIDNVGTSAGNSKSLVDVEYLSDGETVAQAKLTGTATSNVIEVVGADSGASIVRNDGLSNEIYLAGQKEALLMKFVVNAGNSSSLEIRNMNFDAVLTGGSYSDFTNFKLMRGGTQVGTTEDLDSVKTLTIASINEVIPAGGQATYELVADISTSTTATGLQVNYDDSDSVFFDSNDNEVALTDLTGDSSVVKENAVLTANLDGDTPTSALVLANTSGTEIARYKFSATDGDVDIKDLYFANMSGTVVNTGADARVAAYNLVVNGTVVDSRVPSNWVVNFNLGTANKIVVPKDGSMVVTVEADFNSITADTQTNKKIALELTDLKANTSVTSKALTVVNATTIDDGVTHYVWSTFEAAGDIRGELMYIRKTQPTLATVALGTTKLLAGEQTIYKFTVTADAKEDVSVARVQFDVTLGSAAGTIGSYKLLVNGEDKTTTYGAFTWSAASGTLAFEFTDVNKDAVVAAGTTKTFELKATLGGTLADNDYVTTKLVEDTTSLSAGAETRANAIADTNAKFVWSDNSGAPHSATTADYFNGYKVVGLDTDASTLEK